MEEYSQEHGSPELIVEEEEDNRLQFISRIFTLVCRLLITWSTDQSPAGRGSFWGIIYTFGGERKVLIYLKLNDQNGSGPGPGRLLMAFRLIRGNSNRNHHTHTTTASNCGGGVGR